MKFFIQTWLSCNRETRSLNCVSLITIFQRVAGDKVENLSHPSPAEAIKSWAIKVNWHEEHFYSSTKFFPLPEHKQVIMTKVLLYSRPYECMWLYVKFDINPFMKRKKLFSKMKLILFANFRNHVFEIFAFILAVFVEQTFRRNFMVPKDVSFYLSDFKAFIVVERNVFALSWSRKTRKDLTLLSRTVRDNV